MATRWFLIWLVIGAAFELSVLAILSVGIFIAPLAFLLLWFTMSRPRSLVGVSGVISGLGVPPLVVAYLNRDGPGTICHPHSGGISCTEQWSPWPWLLVGGVLLLGGVLVFERRQRTRH